VERVPQIAQIHADSAFGRHHSFVIRHSDFAISKASVISVVLPVIRVHSCKFEVKDSYGAAKPISIGAPGFCVFTITALSDRTSMSLYVRFPSAVARGNSWSLRTSNSLRPPQL